MPSSNALQRAAALLLFLSTGPLTLAAKKPHTTSSLSAFEHAEKQRESLEGRPSRLRSRADYERVLNEYRAIYRADSSSPEADAAVDAVASLLAEEARDTHDPSLFNEAIQQYTYLRQNYPGSPFGQSALLSQAEISQSDLHNYTAARQYFTDFLRLFPHAPLAGEARQQLRALGRQEQAYRNPPPPRTASPLPPSPPQSAPDNRPAPAPVADNTGKPVLITGIRHWSTPVYTRVAIDLSDQVQYEAARVPDPDRIYFDLRGAHLAPELIGKSFAINDDGFLQRIRTARASDSSTRIVLDVSHVSEYSAFLLPNPWRLIIDIHGTASARPSPSQSLTATSGGPVKAPAANNANEVAALSRQPNQVRATPGPTSGPIAAATAGAQRAQQSNEPAPSLNSALPPSAPASAGETPALTAIPPAGVKRLKQPNNVTKTVSTNLAPENPALADREATPTAAGQRSLVRALGLKIGRIVIDAGHGGHDSGTVGAGGIQEKDVVLDVSLRLGKLLKQRLGADVIYTRDDNTFVPLETRTAIANKAQADLFISVHANSSSDSSARGVEVYYLNFTTSPDALETAARENAVSDQSVYQLSDLVKKITLKDKIDESREFATDVENSLFTGLEAGNPGLKERGVKKAPFVVLIGANMPSVLAEISFLTNPDDAEKLRDPFYRQRIAESIYNGIARYVSGLSGVRLAQNGTTPKER